MYGFVVWRDLRKTEDFAELFIKTHTKVNPFRDTGITYHNLVLDHFKIVWYQPQKSSALPLLSFANNDQKFVLFWGELFGRSGEFADYVLKRITKGKHITNLNGNYSIVIIDKASGKVSISSDFIGRRKLFYTHSTDTFAVSNLDHMLIPFNLASVRYDEVSLISSLYFDWSIQGKSFLRGIETTQPDAIVEVYHDHIKKIPVKYNLSRENVHLEDIYDEFIRSLNARTEGADEVHFDLTAGLDTRTVLALLLSMNADNLTAWTLGTSGMDYQVARKLSHKYKIRHRISSAHLADEKDFETHARYLAYCMNGDTNAMRAVNKINVDPSRKIPKIIGIYGTTMLGKNVPGTKDSETFSSTSFKNRHNIIVKDDSFTVELKERLSAYIEEVASTYPHHFEEMYYFRERCGTWGSVVFNSTWDNQHITPFEDIVALQKGLSLPKDVRYQTKSQHYILKKTSPFLYWYPINNNIFNNEYTSFIPAALRLKAGVFVNKVNGKLNRIFNPNRTDIFSQRKETFNTYFHGSVEPLLKHENSISRKLLDSDYLQALCGNLKDDNNGCFVNAQLYSIELWRCICEEMRGLN